MLGGVGAGRKTTVPIDVTVIVSSTGDSDECFIE